MLPAMHVGFNLIYLIPGRTGGMEIVARELIPAIARARPDLRLTAFVNEEAAGEQGPWRDAADWVVVPVSSSNRLQWIRGEQILLPRLAAERGVDLVHSLGATAPVRGRFCRVVNLYDFNYRLLPETHSRILGLGLDVLVRLGVARTDRIVVCSQSTARDTERLLGVASALIDVVPLGLGATPVREPTAERVLRERLDVPAGPVVLTLSDKRAHKNLVRLVEAFGLLAPEQRGTLVIAGHSTGGERQLLEAIARLSLEGSVRVHGWLPAEDRDGLYALASAFVFPSLYEGFGMPVLEAMARGVPVACSNAASLPEVAGDAALLFEPTDVVAIADAIATLLAGGAEVERLRRAGLDRARGFTWQRAASLTLDSYGRALAVPRLAASSPSPA
jgi:glycosyltransferase involved in cell wall biosynthesis